MNYANKHNGLLDEFADLSGILFGYLILNYMPLRTQGLVSKLARFEFVKIPFFIHNRCALNTVSFKAQFFLFN